MNWPLRKGLEAASIANEFRFTTISAESFIILARAYLDQRETKRAETYLSKAEKLALQINNDDLLSRVYNLAGVNQFCKQQRHRVAVI